MTDGIVLVENLFFIRVDTINVDVVEPVGADVFVAVEHTLQITQLNRVMINR